MSHKRVSQQGQVTDEVVQRLREAQRRLAVQNYHDGKQHGRVWACKHADAAQLRRLREFLDHIGPDRKRYFSSYGHSAYSLAERLFFVMNPENDSDRDAAREFWDAGGDSGLLKAADPSTFLRGFAVGAVAVWAAVEKKL